MTRRVRRYRLRLADVPATAVEPMAGQLLLWPDPLAEVSIEPLKPNQGGTDGPVQVFPREQQFQLDRVRQPRA